MKVKYLTLLALNTKATEIGNKTPNTTSFITIASKSQVELKLKKLQKFDVSYLIGKSYFDNDGLQNHLIFHPIHNTFTNPAGDTDIVIA